MERVMGPLPEARRRVVVVESWSGMAIVEILRMRDWMLSLAWLREDSRF